MNKLPKIISISILLSVIVAIVLGVMNTRAILDYIALRNYTPSSEVVLLADDTSMNDATRKVFYVNSPDLLDKSTFSKACTQQEETIVLGCYIQNDGIYLLKIDDSRLDGIVEVTAAHEVLHAMYDRLSSDERVKVDAMTDEFFKTLKDSRIRENIENYRKRDAAVVPNELHSILATEVRDLSPELEAYYSKYFNNRKSIVELSEKYEKTFVDLENQAERYDQDLKSLKAKLDTNEAEIDNLGKTIDAERTELDTLINAQRVAEYNAKVPGFNASVNNYNGLVKTRQSLISQYNASVEAFNKIATTEAELYDSLKAPKPIEDKALN